jgi:hypothetical protein
MLCNVRPAAQLPASMPFLEPSQFLRITCDHWGKGTMLNEAHATGRWREMTPRPSCWRPPRCGSPKPTRCITTSRVTGPTSQLARFAQAAGGAGIIPWQLDLDSLEEDFFHALVAPPAPQRRSLSLAGALRDAAARRRDFAVARVGHGRGAADTETAASIATWEDPPRRGWADTAPVLAVDGFAGPLDWLLDLAHARKIDLARLSIAALIEAFATAMTAARRTVPPPASRTGRPGRCWRPA